MSADRTAALLSPPENPSPSIDGFDDTTLLAPLEVQLPSGIERIGLALTLICRRIGMRRSLNNSRRSPFFPLRLVLNHHESRGCTEKYLLRTQRLRFFG